MFLWWIDIAVHTVKHVLWYLETFPLPRLGSVQEHDTQPKPERPPNIPPPPPTFPVASTASLLFALVIGIDEYYDSRVKNLSGAVADAEDVETFLIETMNVSPSRITKLHNREATRENIKECIRGLATHPDIKKGDPILIFYAGHGSEAVPPRGWPAGGPNKKIQMLVPYDFIPSTVLSERGQGIPDITLSVLLTRIAKAKGDNITVILDCCYSGSGTRMNTYDSTLKVRGISLPRNYAVVPRLDEDVLLDYNRVTAVAPGHENAGLSSHVLLAACTKEQLAKEDGRRGIFTMVLLKTMRLVGTDQITYKELITRLPDLAVEQNPQCEGVHQTRILFDGKAPSQGRVLYGIALKDGVYTLEAGEAHGVTNDAHFEVYKDQNVGSPPLGTLVAHKTGVFTTEMQLADPNLAFKFLEPGFALQTRVGKENDLRLSVALDDRLVYVFDRVKDEMKSRHIQKRAVSLVEKDATPDLIVEVENDHAVFDVTDEICQHHGLTRMPFRVAIDVDVIFPVIRSAADFYWHLRRSSKIPVLSKGVAFECTKLKESGDFTDELEPIMTPDSDNLNRDGLFTVFVDDGDKYGFNVINNLRVSLYVSLFYFDVSDLSIASYYQPGTAKNGRVYEPLPAGGSLTIGYGSGGAPPQYYFLRDEQDVDVGFLKLFLTTGYVDFSNIPQASPFDPNRPTSPFRPKKPSLWDTLLVTVVQRRGRREDAM